MIKLKRSNITIICNLIFVLWEIIICFGKRIGSSRDHLFIFQFYYVNLLTYKNSGGKVTILDLFTRKNNKNNKKKNTISFSWALSILLVKLFSFTFQPPHVLCPWCYFNLFLAIILKWLILLLCPYSLVKNKPLGQFNYLSLSLHNGYWTMLMKTHTNAKFDTIVNSASSPFTNDYSAFVLLNYSSLVIYMS